MKDGDKPHNTQPDSLDWTALRAKSLQPYGFGEDRVAIWPRLLHVQGTSLEQEEDGNDDKQGVTHSDERQIELDTNRSFVLYPVEDVANRDQLQASLYQLIVSIFRRRPRLHYFQGYHDIVSVLYLTLPAEVQSPAVEKMSLHRLRDSMGTSLEPVVGLLRMLKNILQLADESFSATLERSAPLPYYALSNLLTLFSHDVPTLPLIQHIFDYILCRPPAAIVYLAAAMVLTRKEEAQLMEEEGEEGMLHSVLSGLPDMYEEGEEIVGKTEDAAVPVKSEDVTPTTDSSTPAEDTESETLQWEPEDEGPHASSDAPHKSLDLDVPPPTPESPTEQFVEVPRSTDEADSSSQISRASSPDTATSRSVVTPLGMIDDTMGVKSDDGRTDTDSPIDLMEEKVAIDTVSSSPERSGTPTYGMDEQDRIRTATPSPERVDTPEENTIDEKAEIRTSTPSPEPSVRRPRVSLTALLTHADELYARFPPSHPSVGLASIMGPQSVLHTWSEDPAALPDDDDAERMVLTPALVVLPHIEPEDEVPSDEAEGGKSRGGKGKKPRRRLKKPRRLTDVVLERRTMVAGAVLVLGVAVAVYGMSAGSSAHAGRPGFGREWRKAGRVAKGVLVGMGERVLRVGRHAAE